MPQPVNLAAAVSAGLHIFRSSYSDEIACKDATLHAAHKLPWEQAHLCCCSSWQVKLSLAFSMAQFRLQGTEEPLLIVVQGMHVQLHKTVLGGSER